MKKIFNINNKKGNSKDFLMRKQRDNFLFAIRKKI